MEERLALIIIASYFIIDYFVSRHYYHHCNPTAQLYIFLHHVITSMLYFGWLFNNKVVLTINLLLILTILLDWLNNKNLCSLTVKHNRLCGLPDDAPFKDTVYALGIKDSRYANLFYYGQVIFIIVVTIYKLLKN
jgi:hypothetical protein